MQSFFRIEKLPPYVLAEVEEEKAAARKRGEELVDFGLGNPDQDTPADIVKTLVDGATTRGQHRYMPSKGIDEARVAIARWYKNRFAVEIDPATEAVVTIGSKEGIAHLLLAMLGPGRACLSPAPAYPIHQFGVAIAGAELATYAVGPGIDICDSIVAGYDRAATKPMLLIVNFPHNPTAETVDLKTYERIFAFARAKDMWVVSDLAYADITFGGFEPPSFLQVAGAKERAVEFFTVSKSYNMPGWRVGFCVGCREMTSGLARLKTYMDYGSFGPLQLGAARALATPRSVTREIAALYESRCDALVAGLNRAGWPVTKPRGTMFLWTRVPNACRDMSSMAFAKWLIREAKVAVAPGVGFGEGGEGFVRFAFVEDVAKIERACRQIGDALLARTNAQR
ncbi:MAG: aminotransferase class I/II-fold pyridoxal phosphate-dependent enzyme [Deltaproteobacteria bacterium]|nr:aminotransferase class I/II-fold pyridoxal phosphate-dependent enzyme [Deltaproteobacteria bacterium]